MAPFGRGMTQSQLDANDQRTKADALNNDLAARMGGAEPKAAPAEPMPRAITAGNKPVAPARVVQTAANPEPKPERETTMAKKPATPKLCEHPGCTEPRARAWAVTPPHLAVLCREHRAAKAAEGKSPTSNKIPKPTKPTKPVKAVNRRETEARAWWTVLGRGDQSRARDR
jgi:hypothetical protein